MIPADFLPTHPASRTARVLTRCAVAVVAFARNIGHRREIRTLLELDERALKDIGLMRNDVVGALAQPLFTDPSTVLLVRQVERRARERTLDGEVLRQEPAGWRVRRSPARL